MDYQMAPPKKDIKSLCEQEWDKWKADCSGFLKAVAGDLGISLTGQANDIIDLMGRAPWTQIGLSAESAVGYANRGFLVVAGLKAKGHGHVAIIMPGSAKPNPIGYWGRFGGTGRKNTPINWSWNKADLAQVQYFSIQP
jgi:hypothetical protein